MLNVYSFYINLVRSYGVYGEEIFDKWFRFWTTSGSLESRCSAYRVTLNP